MREVFANKISLIVMRAFMRFQHFRSELQAISAFKIHVCYLESTIRLEISDMKRQRLHWKRHLILGRILSHAHLGDPLAKNFLLIWHDIYLKIYRMNANNRDVLKFAIRLANNAEENRRLKWGKHCGWVASILRRNFFACINNTFWFINQEALQTCRAKFLY